MKRISGGRSPRTWRIVRAAAIAGTGAAATYWVLQYGLQQPVVRPVVAALAVAGAFLPLWLAAGRLRRRRADGGPSGGQGWFQWLIENASDIVSILAKDGTVLFASQSVARVLGYGPKEVEGRNLVEFVHPDDRELAAGTLGLAVQAPSVINDVRYRFRHADGQYRVLESGAKAVVADDGGLQFVVSSRDVTERVAAEEALRSSEARYRTLFDDNPVMFFELEPDGTIRSVNRFGAGLLGYDVAALAGLSALALHAEGERSFFRRQLAAAVAGPGAVGRWSSCLERKDGSPLWVRVTARPIVAAGGSVTVLVVCEDVSEVHRLSDEIGFRASHDDLTGLPNRRAFKHRLHELLAAARGGDEQHVLCLLDLDQFKVVNDTSGHAAGDELLRQVGQILVEAVRRGDRLARLGGDEFALVLEDCGLRQGMRVAGNLRKAIEEHRFRWGKESHSLGASIGLVPLRPGHHTVSRALSAASAACHAAKERGRNRIHIYRDDDAHLARRHGEMLWVTRIQRALDENRLRLAAQPIMPVHGETLGGPAYELLVRMQDEDGAVIYPGVFLPAAERYNLAVRVDRWVVDTALRWLAGRPEWVSSMGLCSINLSGQTLAENGFLEHVTGLLRDTAVPPQKVCFEITETSAIADLPSAQRFIETLRALGCRFALDDFGSGVSSLGYLKNLPVDLLKIDGLFIRDIHRNPVDRVMVQSIHDIGRAMGKHTVAEFVENEAILQALREIGIDFAQGYALGRPRPIDEIAPVPAGGAVPG